MNAPSVRLNIVLTAIFVVSTVLTAWIFAPWMRAGIVVVDLVLFTVGVVGFLWGYFAAVQRSRTDEISVAGLFLLMGNVAPKPIARIMSWCLGIQVVVGIAGAIARNSVDGKSGSTLAFGVLVGMCGLGLNGMWAAKHGYFAPRQGGNESPREPDIGNDRNHG
jgi:hypothetical protein